MLSPLLSYFALECALKTRGIKLKGELECLVHMDCINLLCGKINPDRENRETSVVASDEFGLEVIAETTLIS
jgi:hypothetical protein